MTSAGTEQATAIQTTAPPQAAATRTSAPPDTAPQATVSPDTTPGETTTGDSTPQDTDPTPAPTHGRLVQFIDAMIAMGQTGQVFGEHGIGKTATFLSHIPRAHPGTEVIVIPAANLTPDDLLVNAPVRDPDSGEPVLTQLIMRQPTPGTRSCC